MSTGGPGFDGLEFVYNDSIPEGTYYLTARSNLDYHRELLWELDTFTLQQPLWGPAPSHFSEAAAQALDEVRAHHERIFDDMCKDLGLDPQKTWRTPRAQALAADQWNAMNNWRFDERVSMAIINPRASAVVRGIEP